MSSESRAEGVGATDELSLRVSVATLARVVFMHPNDGESMLALERRATLIEDGGGPRLALKSQPFGGVIRLRSLSPLRSLIGDFHFDSERSRAERDFRIFIRPSDWDALRDSLLWRFSTNDDSLLELDPDRELAEEFSETLGIDLRPEQYTTQHLGTVLENEPAATENAYARGYPTVRVYRVFESRIVDPALSQLVIAKGDQWTNETLREQALEDSRRGGRGWVNSVLSLRLRPLMEFYLAVSPEARKSPVEFESNLLDASVCAVLEGVSAPKYQRL